MDNMYVKCSCKTSAHNISNYPELEDILPGGYKYTVCDYTEDEQKMFYTKFRVDVRSKEEALSWLEKFKFSSGTVFNKAKTFPRSGKNIVYKLNLKCHHNTRPKATYKSSHAKHTNCPSYLDLTVKKTQLVKNYKSTDVHLKEFPMAVILKHYHNHAIIPAGDLEFHLPKSEVKELSLNSIQTVLTSSKATEEYTCQTGIFDEWFPSIQPGKQQEMNQEESMEISRVTDLSAINIYKLAQQGENDDNIDTIQIPVSKENLSIFNDEQEINDKTRTINQLKKVFNELVQKVEQSEDTCNATKAFINSFNKLKTEKSLNSSLRSFGKFSCFSSKKKGELMYKRIGVQPTSTSKCKAPFGGHPDIHSLRSPKKTYTTKHGNSQSELNSSLLLKVTVPYIVNL